MKKRQRDKFEKILGSYFEEIHRIYVGGNFREESFYPSLKLLVEEGSRLLGNLAGVLVQPKRTRWGFPIFSFGKMAGSCVILKQNHRMRG